MAIDIYTNPRRDDIESTNQAPTTRIGYYLDGINETPDPGTVYPESCDNLTSDWDCMDFNPNTLPYQEEQFYYDISTVGLEYCISLNEYENLNKDYIAGISHISYWPDMVYSYDDGWYLYGNMWDETSVRYKIDTQKCLYYECPDIDNAIVTNPMGGHVCYCSNFENSGCQYPFLQSPLMESFFFETPFIFQESWSYQSSMNTLFNNICQDLGFEDGWAGSGAYCDGYCEYESNYSGEGIKWSNSSSRYSSHNVDNWLKLTSITCDGPEGGWPTTQRSSRDGEKCCCLFENINNNNCNEDTIIGPVTICPEGYGASPCPIPPAGCPFQSYDFGGQIFTSINYCEEYNGNCECPSNDNFPESYYPETTCCVFIQHECPDWMFYSGICNPGSNPLFANRYEIPIDVSTNTNPVDDFPGVTQNLYGITPQEGDTIQFWDCGPGGRPDCNSSALNGLESDSNTRLVGLGVITYDATYDPLGMGNGNYFNNDFVVLVSGYDNTDGTGAVTGHPVVVRYHSWNDYMGPPYGGSFDIHIVRAMENIPSYPNPADWPSNSLPSVPYTYQGINHTPTIILSRRQLGDINQDNNVNVSDVMQMVDYILQLTPIEMLPEIEQVLGDLNADGQINVFDIMHVANIILGSPTVSSQQVDELNRIVKELDGTQQTPIRPTTQRSSRNCDPTAEVELWDECYNIEETTYLNLQVSGLTGEIPTEIGNLTNLTYLNLGSNNLTGEIPPEIWNTNFTSLNLRSNNLTGEIPSSIGNLTNLTYLNLYDNHLSGEIPSSIGNLTDLTSLKLYDNFLSGEIPSSIGNLTNLTYLNLSNNQLTGVIPSEICNQGDSTPSLSDNQFCPTYPECLTTNDVGNQDTSMCPGGCDGNGGEVDDNGDCCPVGTEIDDCGECGGNNSSCGGCMDSNACNYNPSATVQVECVYPNIQCFMDQDLDNLATQTRYITNINPLEVSHNQLSEPMLFCSEQYSSFNNPLIQYGCPPCQDYACIGGYQTGVHEEVVPYSYYPCSQYDGDRETCLTTQTDNTESGYCEYTTTCFVEGGSNNWFCSGDNTWWTSEATCGSDCSNWSMGGCTHQPTGNFDDCPSVHADEIFGCNDQCASNFNEEATWYNGSCYYGSLSEHMCEPFVVYIVADITGSMEGSHGVPGIAGYEKAIQIVEHYLQFDFIKGIGLKLYHQWFGAEYIYGLVGGCCAESEIMPAEDMLRILTNPSVEYNPYADSCIPDWDVQTDYCCSNVFNGAGICGSGTNGCNIDLSQWLGGWIHPCDPAFHADDPLLFPDGNHIPQNRSSDSKITHLLRGAQKLRNYDAGYEDGTGNVKKILYLLTDDNLIWDPSGGTADVGQPTQWPQTYDEFQEVRRMLIDDVDKVYFQLGLTNQSWFDECYAEGTIEYNLGAHSKFIYGDLPYSTGDDCAPDLNCPNWVDCYFGEIDIDGDGMPDNPYAYLDIGLKGVPEPYRCCGSDFILTDSLTDSYEWVNRGCGSTSCGNAALNNMWDTDNNGIPDIIDEWLNGHPNSSVEDFYNQYFTECGTVNIDADPPIVVSDCEYDGMVLCAEGNCANSCQQCTHTNITCANGNCANSCQQCNPTNFECWDGSCTYDLHDCPLPTGCLDEGALNYKCLCVNGRPQRPPCYSDIEVIQHSPQCCLYNPNVGPIKPDEIQPRSGTTPITPGDSVRDIDGIKTEEVSEESFKPELLNENNFTKNLVMNTQRPDIINDSIIVKFKQTSDVIKQIPVKRKQSNQITTGESIRLPQKLNKLVPKSFTNVTIKKIADVPFNEPFGDMTVIRFDKQDDLDSIKTMVRNFNADPEVEYAEMNQIFYIQEDPYINNNLTWPLYNDGDSGIQWSAIFGQMTSEETQNMGIYGVDTGWVNARNENLFQSNDEPVIAVMDTGVDMFHRDMVNQVWVNPECEQNGVAVNQKSINVLNNVNSDAGTNFQGCRDIIHYLHEHEHELNIYKNVDDWVGHDHINIGSGEGDHYSTSSHYTPQDRTYWIENFYKCISSYLGSPDPENCNDGYFGINARVMSTNIAPSRINYAFDGHGHGSHCAGTIAAEGNNNHGFAGVCPNCKIMSIKVGSATGGLDTTSILYGYYYILNMKINKGVNIRVVNNSWGGSYSESIQEVITMAYEGSDIISVFAAGNSSVDMSTGSSSRTTLNNSSNASMSVPDTTYEQCANTDDEDFLQNNCSNRPVPWTWSSGGQACLNQHENSIPGMVVNVAALDSHGDLAWFSNYGNGPYCKVDIAAPGENILSLKPSHACDDLDDLFRFHDIEYEDVMIRFFGCNGYEPNNPYSTSDPTCLRKCTDAQGSCPGQFNAQGEACCHNSFDDSGQPHYDVSSIFDNYALMSGTSMAAPHVSGLIGLIISINPNLSANEIIDVMKTHGTKNIDEHLTSSYETLGVQTIGELPPYWSPDYGQDMYCDFSTLSIDEGGVNNQWVPPVYIPDFYHYKCSKRTLSARFDYPVCYSDQDCLYHDNFCDPDNTGYPCMVEDFTQCTEGSCIGAGMMDVYGLLQSYHAGNIGTQQHTYELHGGNNFISFPFEMDNNSVTDFMIEHNVINVLGQGVGLFNDNGNITGNYTNFEPEHGFTINLPGSNMDNITITISGVQSLSPLVYDLMSLGTNSTYKISYDGLDDMNTIEALGEWENSIEFIIGDGQGLFNECHGTGTSCWEGNLSSLKWGSGYYIQTQGGIAEFQWNRIMMTASSTSTTLPDRDVKNKIKQLGLGNKSEAQQQTPIRPGDSVRDIDPG